jgi:mannose-6-phosphate isomerase-like protein (cupin superfamily)
MTERQEPLDARTVLRMIEAGTIHPSSAAAMASGAWTTRPGRDGVALRDLAPGAVTDGAFSCHVARMKPGAAVVDHLHDDQWEWNLVLAGSGTLMIGDETVPFRAGDTFVNPPRVLHSVEAGAEEVVLLAVFVPGRA